jgi:invasion protein IalB
MSSLKSKAYRLSVMAAGVAGFLAAGLPQASAQQIPQGWFKACSKQEDVDICNVQNIVTAGNGQLVTGVSMIDLRGKVNRKVFQVTVPSGRLVPPGIALQVDGGKAQKLDYVICFPDRCVAEVPMTDQLVASFKKGSQIVLTSINFQNQPNPIQISLEGFTGAFEGPAMQASDLEDRQKKLQEFVSKNNEDFAKKLKEEQEKAKAAGN